MMDNSEILLWHMREAWKGIGGTPEEAKGKAFSEMVVGRYDALREKASRLAAQNAALVEVLEGVALLADFGYGEEKCWCHQGYLDGMPDDSEPDFHASYCKAARAALAAARGEEVT